MSFVKRTIGWAFTHGLPRLIVAGLARLGDPIAALIVDARVREDPYPALAELRERGSLVPGRLTSISCSHAFVREVLRSDDMGVGTNASSDSAFGRLERISRWARDPLAVGPLDPPSLLALDPPEHSRYRTLVGKVFTARAVERLRARTEEIAAGLLEEMAAKALGETAAKDPGEMAAGSPGRGAAQGRVDLIADYAVMLPVTVIAEILGVPESERGRVLTFGAGAAPSLDLGLSYGAYRHVQESLVQFHRWLGDHLDQLRRHPGDDLLSQLLTAEVDGVGLSDLELRATAGLLLAAGFETTVNLLGSGAALLARHPEALALLRADPTRWPNAVDELLRLESPVALTSRVALRDVELGGQRLRAGRFVTLHLAGANRDPAVFPDPDRLDVARANAREHLAFSGGRHFCVGAALARMEGQVGLQRLFERFPDLALAPGATRRQTRVLRGWQTLPVVLAKTSARAAG